VLGVPGRPPSNARLGYRPRVRPLPPLEILSRPGKLILSDAQRAELLDVYGVIADTASRSITLTRTRSISGALMPPVPATGRASAR